MPKKYRLTGDEMRQLPRDRGAKRIHGRFFSLLVTRVKDGHAKCAVVVSTKIASKAVERNKIKRRARSLLAQRITRVAQPHALVFYAKRDARDATFAAIESDIDELFSKL
jgi:ribonuclease P protein component